MSSLLFHLGLLCHFHHPEPVAAPYFGDVFFAVSAAEQLDSEVDELGRIGHARYTAVAIKVGSDANMVDAHDLDGVFEVVDAVDDAGFCTV